MGAILVIYLAVAAVIGGTVLYTMLYAAVKGHAPFGWESPYMQAAVDRQNKALRDMVFVAGPPLGAAAFIFGALCTSLLALAWPYFVYVVLRGSK